MSESQELGYHQFTTAVLNRRVTVNFYRGDSITGKLNDLRYIYNSTHTATQSPRLELGMTLAGAPLFVDCDPAKDAQVDKIIVHNA